MSVNGPVRFLGRMRRQRRILTRPTVRHQLIENRGASITVHESCQLQKKNKKNSHRNVLPLDRRLLMGDPSHPPGCCFYVDSATSSFAKLRTLAASGRIG